MYFFILHPLTTYDKVIGSLNKNKMKQKKTHYKILNWIKDAWLKAIVVLLIVAGGFYAYAAITWPSDEPNPTTGVVGMFVGESSTAYIAAGSYDKVNAFCASITTYDNKPVTGSHVCTQDEMINSYNHGNKAFSAIFKYYNPPTQPNAFLWINSGPPGYTSNANDCKGWATIKSPLANQNFGRVWNFADQYGSLLPCDNTGFKFACCQ